MTPFLVEPPTPQRFFRRPARSRRPASSSGTSWTVVTALPRRPAVSRLTRTRSPPARFEPAGRASALRRSPSLVDQTSCRSRGMARDASEHAAEDARVAGVGAQLTGALDEQPLQLAGRPEGVAYQLVFIEQHLGPDLSA